MVDGTEAVALLGGLASAVAVVATSFRKRQDVDLEEMRERITELTNRLGDAEKEIGRLRSELVKAETRVFNLQRVMASHGIDPDTAEHHHEGKTL